jgi:hypothetical protein
MIRISGRAGTADITPEAALPLAGSEIRTGVFRRVADRLEANALVLRQDGPPVVFVSVDLMFVGPELRTGVLSRLGGAVPDECLFFAASHTHFAPATDDRRPRLGRLDHRYLEQTADRIGTLVAGLLHASPTPVTVAYRHGQADHSMNRRLRAAWHLSRRGPRIGAVVTAPNPAGPRDESLHLLQVSDPAGAPVALIWSYACHPVAFPRPLEVSADFPGRARRRLRERLAPALPVLFWQGFAGDIRPPELVRSSSFVARAQRLLLGPRFGRFTEAEWEAWADSLAARVTDTATGAEPRALTGPIHAARETRPLRDFVFGAPAGRTVTFHTLRFGSDVTVAGISAEVVTEYGPLVRRTFHPSTVIPVGYIDDVYGYLPVERMLGEGGYEASWFLEPFALEGPVRPRIEETTLEALRALAAQA